MFRLRQPSSYRVLPYSNAFVQVCDFMTEHEATFANLAGKEKKEFHAHVMRMRESAEWGTADEISAFATLTGTPIATFTEDRWIFYKPRFSIDDDGTITGEHQRNS